MYPTPPLFIPTIPFFALALLSFTFTLAIVASPTMDPNNFSSQIPRQNDNNQAWMRYIITPRPPISHDTTLFTDTTIREIVPSERLWVLEDQGTGKEYTDGILFWSVRVRELEFVALRIRIGKFVGHLSSFRSRFPHAFLVGFAVGDVDLGDSNRLMK